MPGFAFTLLHSETDSFVVKYCTMSDYFKKAFGEKTFNGHANSKDLHCIVKHGWSIVWGRIFVYFHLYPIKAKVYKKFLHTLCTINYYFKNNKTKMNITAAVICLFLFTPVTCWQSKIHETKTVSVCFKMSRSSKLEDRGCMEKHG